MEDEYMLEAPEDINIILFHATKKEKLKIIMKEGIKPGEGKGGITVPSDGVGMKNYVYFYPSFGVIQADYDRFKWAGIDTILIVGLPAERVLAPDEDEDIPIKEYEEKYEYRQRFEDLLEVMVKGNVSPEYIIACLDIVEMEPIYVHSWKFKPIKCVSTIRDTFHEK